MGPSCCITSSQEACHHFPILHGLALISKGPGALCKLSVSPASKVQPPLGQRSPFCWGTDSACILARVDVSDASNAAALDLPPWQQPCEIQSMFAISQMREKPRHWEIRWLGSCMGHQKSWGQATWTPSQICPPLVAHVNGWALHTWQCLLLREFGEVSGVRKLIHLCLQVCEPSRGNKNNLLWEGIVDIQLTVLWFTANRLLDAMSQQ